MSLTDDGKIHVIVTDGSGAPLRDKPATTWTLDVNVMPFGTHVLRYRGRIKATFNPDSRRIAQEVCNVLNLTNP